MQVSPDTLRAAYVALVDAHAYIAHPVSQKPCARHRIATHKVSTHHYGALDANLQSAIKALSDILRADPVPT